ncbi:FAD binding domain-containing protein [Burkholderia sp. Ac-20353]|uniref:FAD binding domain-containing protein n=1 Tax=Burkholderia sp. Ac-20353 TaxID=2703894 RepID=UPI00197B3BD3|nr:FAD binding domain-containing protein [Burkholderia sp. Ac-20353]MBN3786419.1 FAD-dependent oxidoreductase [Burkholderia sp. Ac-20353]
MQVNQTDRRKAVIVGGSLGGLFAANLLLRSGWDVTVLERVPDELAGRGAGIVTHPELFEALEAAGVEVNEDIGVTVHSRITLNSDGSVAGSCPLTQTLTAWSKMFHVLRSALPDACYRSGAIVENVSSFADHAEVTLSDGTKLQADLVVAADGFRSNIRQTYLPKVELQYVGYIAWRGLVDERELTPEAWEMLFDKFGFCLPSGEQMLGYPVAGPGNSTRPGERRYNFVWYRPTDESVALRDLLTDANGNYYANGIPPHLIRPDVLADMREAAHDLLSPEFAEVVHKTKQPLFQPIYDLEATQLVFDRIVLLGDAAFVARPHCGMGVTKAAGDAVQLAESLAASNDIHEALADYERKRLQFGGAIVEHARHLGAYMQAQMKSQLERDMAEKYRTPEAVMRETAVAPII